MCQDVFWPSLWNVLCGQTGNRLQGLVDFFFVFFVGITGIAIRENFAKSFSLEHFFHLLTSLEYLVS